MSSGEQRALPFITVDDAGQFVIGEEAAARLSEIDLPIAVVAVAGEYRTGKSYLMNLLKRDLPDENAAAAGADQSSSGTDVVSDGFVVGHSVQACTKGVWLWGEPVEVEGKNMSIVFLDTEGLGSTQADPNYDARIFALALLLGSTFVYNSRGTIDGQAIDTLSLVVNLTKFIHLRANAHGNDNPNDVQEFHDYFPSLMWVVRDCTLELKTMGANGRSLTPRDYLNRSLEDLKGVSKEVSAMNNIRRVLRTVFPEKDCVTLVKPVSDEKKARELPSIPWSDLRDEFKRGVKRLKSKLFSAIQPKMLFGRQLNGPMLLELSRSYVEAFNSGSAPTISSAWERVVTAQCREGMGSAMSVYENAMHQDKFVERPNSKMHGKVVVFDEEELMARHDEHYKNAKDILRKKIETVAAGSNDATRVMQGMMEELGTKVRKLLGKIKEQNAEDSDNYCKQLIERLDKEEAARAAEVAQTAKARFGLGASPGAPSVSTSMPAAPAADSSPPKEEKGKSKQDIAVAAQLAEIRRLKAEKAAGVVGSPSKPTNSGSIGTKLRSVQSVCDRTVKAYNEEARGPAKWGVLQNYLLGTVLKRMSKTAVEASSSEQVKVSEMRRELTFKTNALTEALADVQVAKKERQAEKKKSQDAMRTLKERSELEKDALTEKHKGELSTLGATVEQQTVMIEHLKKENATLTERLSEGRDDERKWFDREREWNSKEKKLTEKLHEAERKHMQQQQQQQNAAAKAADAVDPSELKKSQEKLKAAQQEVTVLQEHVELLSEHLQMTKDFLATKTQEVSECEYHWASAKAKLAQCESEKMDHETYVVHVLEPIITCLRDKMDSKSLKDCRKLLDAIQEKRLMEL
jgi:hypothetical protein